MFSPYCNDTVTRRVFTRNKWQEKSGYTDYTEDVRFTEWYKWIRNSEGDMTVSSGKVEYDGDKDVNSDDIFVIDGVEYSIIKVKKHKRFTRIDKTEVILK